MKIGFGYGVFLAMAFSAGVMAAGAQSGVAGEQSNPLDGDSASTAHVTTAEATTADVPAAHVPAAVTPRTDVPATTVPVDNGARPGDSHVRIVRLSDVKGTLSLDRKTGNGFEQTMPNMPIVQGEKLRTADGYAEVEFEDNSTLRLAPKSQVDFPLLVLRSSGAKASTMKVPLGTVYVSTESTKGNEFPLLTGATTSRGALPTP